jgi:hypothetical protein
VFTGKERNRGGLPKEVCCGVLSICGGNSGTRNGRSGVIHQPGEKIGVAVLQRRYSYRNNA